MAIFLETLAAEMVSGEKSVSEALSLVEREKVDYWRTTAGGHRIGYKGKPGRGVPIAGSNPHVLKRAQKDHEDGKARRKLNSKTASGRRQNRVDKHNDDHRRNMAKNRRKNRKMNPQAYRKNQRLFNKAKKDRLAKEKE